MLEAQINSIISSFIQNFNSRIISEAARNNFIAALDVERNEHTIIFKMRYNDQLHALEVPVPFVRNGVTLLSRNFVERAVPMYYIAAQDRIITYLDIVLQIFISNVSNIVPSIKSKSSGMQSLKYAFLNGRVSLAVNKLQKSINYFVNDMPLHETDYNSLVTNHRITIFDNEFDVLTDPEDKLNYQVEKNKKFFNRGWTSLGLSDGSLADKNYMLACDLRNLTPFGKYFHNPQRNLYSTLGMLGDETPLLGTEMTAMLAQHSLYRKGWNLFTIFVDIPDVWEDQLMVDISHRDKFVEYEHKIICYGKIVVEEGQELSYGDALSVDLEGRETLFKLECDSAYIESIKQDLTVVGGVQYPSTVISVKFRRYFKDGTKLTNMAANKGCIRMRDLGYAINPATGKEQKIDVIVSAKAILKRKNYTQVLEAVFNTLNNNQPATIPNDATTTTEAIANALEAAGYNRDATWECHTYAGDFKCVAGTIFWGVTHDADDTVWADDNVKRENSRGLRTSGLKFSTIEFRALSTRFGKGNPLEKEILSYAQGSDDIRQMINVLQHKAGKPYLLPTKNIKDIKPIPQGSGTMYTESQLIDTIADPNGYDGAFLLKLPIDYLVVLDKDYNVLQEGFPNDPGNYVGETPVHKKIKLNSIYVPEITLRQCWKHEVGKYGLGDITAALSNIISICHRYMENNTEESTDLTLLYSAIYSYFELISGKLTSKRGELSIHGMSVRYPNSAKGVAVLSTELPPNTIEIHDAIAEPLGIKTDDHVLVERFPCLGFMSLRPQKVVVTDDPLCRYTIRVSGNSLGSESLDFDGDVIYIACFNTKEAREAIKKEWENPNEYCWKEIQRYNEKMGTPHFKEMNLQDYEVTAFDLLTAETHGEIVNKLTGVKSNTGPVVALAYNLLRIMENSNYANDQRLEVGIEVLMDKVANSVFKQKHGFVSLHQIVKDAIASTDEKTLVEHGFDPEVVKIVCSEVRRKAKELGVDDVPAYAARMKMQGRPGTIINKIVRSQNKLYYASRSDCGGCKLVKLLVEAEVVDVPSRIYKAIMASPTRLQRSDAEAISTLSNSEDRAYVEKIFNRINEACLRSVSII